MDKLEGHVLRYWDLSQKGLLFNFQFEKTFKLFRERIKEKLSLHGMLTLDDYISFVGKYYDLETLQSLAYTSFHTGFKDTLEDIKVRLFKPRYEHFRSLYIHDSVYKRILNVYRSLCNTPINLQDQILLMEQAINVAHRDGLFIDIDALRSRYETKIKQLSNDPVFGILTRSALEFYIREINESFYAIFIDFIDLKSMNKKLGYETVNQKISSTLSLIKSEECMMGRWFSGDEILIISQKPFNEDYIQRITKTADTHDVKFKPFFLECQENITSLKKTINRLPMIKRKRDKIQSSIIKVKGEVIDKNG